MRKAAKIFNCGMNRHRSQLGFTMIEMMTVMVIIAIITILAVANYHQENRRVYLDMQANQFAQNLRRTQEWGMAARQIGGTAMPGYGLYVAQSGVSYVLYTDNLTNGRYDLGSDGVQETINLSNNLEVKSINPCGPTDSCSSVSALSVNFVPPSPTTVISDGSGNNFDEATIVLSIKNASTTRSVVINRAGLIYVQ